MYGANKSFADLVLGLRDKGVEPIVLIPKKGFLNSFFEKENIVFLLVKNGNNFLK